MYIGDNFWKQKQIFTSAENSGHHTSGVDLRWAIMKVFKKKNIVGLLKKTKQQIANGEA